MEIIIQHHQEHQALIALQLLTEDKEDPQQQDLLMDKVKVQQVLSIINLEALNCQDLDLELELEHHMAKVDHLNCQEAELALVLHHMDKVPHMDKALHLKQLEAIYLAVE
jgi:hypothetical protein